jgi:hypothetical protein
MPSHAARRERRKGDDGLFNIDKESEWCRDEPIKANRQERQFTSPTRKKITKNKKRKR